MSKIGDSISAMRMLDKGNIATAAESDSNFGRAVANLTESGSATPMSTSSANMAQAPSANMIQSPVGSDGGLAASAGGTAQQPTLTSGVQNTIADSTQFGNRPNGLGVINGLAGSSFRNNFQNNQGMQNQYGIIGGASLI